MSEKKIYMNMKVAAIFLAIDVVETTYREAEDSWIVTISDPYDEERKLVVECNCAENAKFVRDFSYLSVCLNHLGFDPDDAKTKYADRVNEWQRIILEL